MKDKVRRRISGRGGWENDRVKRPSGGKRRRISPEGKEKEREREKDVGRHHERKKERMPGVRRKIEKDCHARHSGGDEGGGVT